MSTFKVGDRVRSNETFNFNLGTVIGISSHQGYQVKLDRAWLVFGAYLDTFWMLEDEIDMSTYEKEMERTAKEIKERNDQKGEMTTRAEIRDACIIYLRQQGVSVKTYQDTIGRIIVDYATL